MPSILIQIPLKQRRCCQHEHNNRSIMWYMTQIGAAYLMKSYCQTKRIGNLCPNQRKKWNAVKMHGHWRYSVPANAINSLICARCTGLRMLDIPKNIEVIRE